MLKVLIIVIVALIVIPAGIIALYFGGIWFAASFIDNPSFAKRYFADLFPYQEVLESREWSTSGHPVTGGGYDCTFAIVSLGEDAPTDPGRRTRKGDPWHWQFGWGPAEGPWSQTPAQPTERERRNREIMFLTPDDSQLPYMILMCQVYWSRDTNDRLRDALLAPGSQYWRVSGGEAIYLYSKPQRVAAYVRFGD